jgi:hypothetical protein
MEFFSNIAPYSRLDEFHNRLDYVLGKHDQEKADLLLEKLAALMDSRNLSRERISNSLGIESWTEQGIEEAIRQINRQAAEIRVFAEEHPGLDPGSSCLTGTV